MLPSSLCTLLKPSKTTSFNKLVNYDCVTLYVYFITIKGGGREDRNEPHELGTHRGTGGQNQEHITISNMYFIPIQGS